MERQSSRPDAVILCYPVITLTDPFTHQSAPRQSARDESTARLGERTFPAELEVNKNSPPCFIWARRKTKPCRWNNSLQLAAALCRSWEFILIWYIYERGPHGIGLETRIFDTANFHPWTRDCEFPGCTNGSLASEIRKA